MNSKNGVGFLRIFYGETQQIFDKSDLKVP